MKEKEPVALWKGIVGTAVSGFILICLSIFALSAIFSKLNIPIWLNILLIAIAIVEFVSLIISIGNLCETTAYKRELRRLNKESSPSKKEDNKKDELLHKLLEEGRITIEEYDELKKK